MQECFFLCFMHIVWPYFLLYNAVHSYQRYCCSLSFVLAYHTLSVNRLQTGIVSVPDCMCDLIKPSCVVDDNRVVYVETWAMHNNWYSTIVNMACYFGRVVILLFMYFISLCVLFSAYCIVLISFVLAMLKWCIRALAIQSCYSFIWWLLFFYYFML